MSTQTLTRDAVTMWADAVSTDPTSLTAEDLRALADAVSGTRDRDAVLVLAITGDPERARATLTGGVAGARSTTSAVESLWDHAHPAVPHGQLPAWINLLALVADTAETPAVWTLLSIMAWWRGLTADAGQAVVRALKIDRDYRLAVLMAHTLVLDAQPAHLH